ncbi:MAG: helix-turn-helix domain-containing protein [Chitinophagales bacterium]
MQNIKQYHLHKNDYSKLQLEIKEAQPYCQKNNEHCFKAHQHSFYQLIWFQKAGRHFVDYELIEHPANTLFFLNRGQVHYFCKKSANEGYLFHFNDLFINRQVKDSINWLQYSLFNEIGLPYVCLTEKELPAFHFFTNSLYNEIEEKELNYQQQLYHLFQALLLKIERLKQQELSNWSVTDTHFMVAMNFKKSIEVNKNQFLSIESYSQMLGVSSKQLTLATKKYLKDTPANIVHKRRILEAKRLLSNTQLSIKEVAYKLGFDQATYFTKYFKKHTDFTPKAFLQQLP